MFQEREAATMWHKYQTLTSALSQQLCEQLRLILEPTQAAKLKSVQRLLLFALTINLESQAFSRFPCGELC